MFAHPCSVGESRAKAEFRLPYCTADEGQSPSRPPCPGGNQTICLLLCCHTGPQLPHSWSHLCGGTVASLAQGRGQGTTSPHPGPVLANHKSLPLLTSAFTPPGPCAAAQWLSSCSLVPRNLSHIPRTSPSCGQLCWERPCWGLLLLWEGWSRAGPGDQGKMSPPPGRAVCAGSDVTAGSTFFFFLSLFYVAYFVSCWEKPIPDWWPLSVSAEMLLLPGPLRGSVPALLTREVALCHRLH